MEKGSMTFVQAMLDYFGKNRKDTAAFMQEMKALSPEEKAWFRKELEAFYDIQLMVSATRSLS